jgi:hypothetical protein
MQKFLLILLPAALFFAYTPAAYADGPITARVYLPFVGTRPAPGLNGKGIASTAGGQFNDILGVRWFYDYSECLGPCISMLRDWRNPARCAPIMLLGNEPASIEPYGFPITPAAAALRSKELRTLCPGSWLVAGNVALPQFAGIPGLQWLQEYIAAGGVADQIGVHSYVNQYDWTVSNALATLDSVKAAFPGRVFCVTEFNNIDGGADEFDVLYAGIRSRVGCYAAFTDHDDTLEYGHDLNLVDNLGQLTPKGQKYAAR